MIENEIKSGSKSSTVASGNATSPISRSYSGKKSQHTNAFLAWLRDEDFIADNNGKISPKSAITSFSEGLIEIVKTVYKRPILSALTITTGLILASVAKAAAIAPIMGLCIISGIIGFCTSIYTIAAHKTSNSTKKGFELMGVSAFLLAIGIYGLIL